MPSIGRFFAFPSYLLLTTALSLLTTAHDKGVGALVIARFVTAGRLAPGSYGMAAAGGFAFASSVRVINWIHRDAAIVRTTSQPAHTSCFVDSNVFVIGITNLTDCSHAVEQHLACLARRQFHQRIVTFFGDQLSSASGRTHHLGAH